MESNERNNKKCEMCRIPATCLCFECFLYFCDSCYKIVHDKLLNDKHKKEKIDYFASVGAGCPKHPKNIIDLFCLDEKGKY